MKALLYKPGENSILSRVTVNEGVSLEDLETRNLNYDGTNWTALMEIFFSIRSDQGMFWRWEFTSRISYFGTQGLIYRWYVPERGPVQVKLIAAFVSDKPLEELGIIIPRDSFEVWIDHAQLETDGFAGVKGITEASNNISSFIEDNYMNIVTKNDKEMEILVKPVITPVKSLDRQLEADNLLLKEALLSI